MRTGADRPTGDGWTGVEPRPGRCLIVDDESPARDELRYLLREIDGVVVVGEAATVGEARVLLSSVDYDIVFLDIRMPGETGLDLARVLRDGPSDVAVVFTTAYPDHAVEAFELAATDYLLKPFDSGRLEEAVTRALRRARTGSGGTETGRERASATTGRGPGPAEHRGRLPVQRGDRTVLIDRSEIVYASAAHGYSYLKLATEQVLVSYSLTELEERLGARAFRAHRSHLVNLDQVQELAPFFGGQLMLVMRDKDRSRIPVSRRQARELRRILGM